MHVSFFPQVSSLLIIYKIILLVSNNNDLPAYLSSLYCMFCFVFLFNNLPWRSLSWNCCSAPEMLQPKLHALFCLCCCLTLVHPFDRQDVNPVDHGKPTGKRYIYQSLCPWPVARLAVASQKLAWEQAWVGRCSWRPSVLLGCGTGPPCLFIPSTCLQIWCQQERTRQTGSSTCSPHGELPHGPDPLPLQHSNPNPLELPQEQPQNLPLHRGEESGSRPTAVVLVVVVWEVPI